VQVLQFFNLFFVQLPPSLAHARIQHQGIAHADAAMNESIGKLDIPGAQGFAPSKDVLVNAVNQGAVKVEEKCGLPMFVAGFVLLRQRDADLACSFRHREQPGAISF
jgi:hypothetical protein